MKNSSTSPGESHEDRIHRQADGITNDNKPPMFGPSDMFDLATHEPRPDKSTLMNQMVAELNGHTIIFAPTHSGMSVDYSVLRMSDAEVAEMQSSTKSNIERNMTTNIKKPIFQNADSMGEMEAEQLMMKVIIYSFSYGLLRFKNIRVSKHLFFLGCEVALLVGLVASQELSDSSIWPSVIWMLYMLSGLFLVSRLKNSTDPEVAMKGQISSLIFKTIK